MIGNYELGMNVFDRMLWLPVTISLRGTNHNVTMYYLDFPSNNRLNTSKEDRTIQKWLDNGQLIKKEVITPKRTYIRHKL